LVTGATGFIGRQTLAPLIGHGFEVHAVARHASGATMDGVVWHEADLLGPATAEALVVAVRPTHLLHLAWITEHGRYWWSPENLDWVAASLTLVRKFQASGGKRVVIAGTCAEYDVVSAEETRRPLAETDSTQNPHTLYGTTKDALNRMVECFARSVGLSWAWGRAFQIYGPHEYERRLVPSVICSSLNGSPAVCTHGRQIRDFLDARDAGTAFAALLDSLVEGPVNIGSGRKSTVAQVARTIARLVGRPDLLRLGVLPTTPDDPPYLVADVKRLTQEVGFRPTIALEEGLRHAVEWWRERIS
jgi:nucleoside-diphosphate-sugar epimerase